MYVFRTLVSSPPALPFTDSPPPRRGKRERVNNQAGELACLLDLPQVLFEYEGKVVI